MIRDAKSVEPLGLNVRIQYVIGIYEHRGLFRRDYETAFEVRKEGVFYRQHLYAWGDIKYIRRNKTSGSAGHGALVFTDGVKCVVNLDTFRKKNEESRISFLGNNHAFDQLREYFLDRKMESFRDPRMDVLNSELEGLFKQLKESNGDDETARIMKTIARVRTEYTQLSDDYIAKINSMSEQEGPITWLMALAVVLLIAAFIWFHYVKPL